MSKSLQDQLLGAGLVDKKKAKQVNKAKRKQKNVEHRQKEVGLTEAQQAAQQAQQEKKEKDLALNQQRQQELAEKEKEAQINQLINHYKINRSKGEQDYNFVVDKIVKKILTTQEQSDQLSRGRLCVVSLGESFEIIPKPVADKIKQRDESRVVVYNYGKETVEETVNDEDEDYYAQFEIPDDLMW